MNRSISVLASLLLLEVGALVMQFGSGNSLQAAEIASEQILNMYEVTEIQRKRDEAFRNHSNVVQLGRYTIRLKL